MRILTLDEVIKALKGRIKINIELKPTGHEENFEQNVIDIVKANGFENDCVLASLNAETLKRIKEIDYTFKTLYILAFVHGDVLNAYYADGFSIEEKSITSQLVSEIHNQEKDVWAWTLNETNSVENMQKCNVDYILIDNPLMAQSALTKKSLNDNVEFILKMIFKEPTQQTVYQQRLTSQENMV